MSEGKQELVRNWLLKASHDLTAARLLSERGQAVLDVAIYHCQQAGEKALKGFLVFWDQRVEKTHDLKALLKKAIVIEPRLAASREAGERLTPYATAYRYPDLIVGPSLEQVEEALNDATGIYNDVLSSLPAEVHPEKTDTDPS
jgi:HEPN domain-containing protein